MMQSGWRRNCRVIFSAKPSLSSKDLALRLRHILQAIDWIEQHLSGMDFAAYEDDPETADAVERNLQRISEAAIRLGD